MFRCTLGFFFLELVFSQLWSQNKMGFIQNIVLVGLYNMKMILINNHPKRSGRFKEEEFCLTCKKKWKNKTGSTYWYKCFWLFRMTFKLTTPLYRDSCSALMKTSTFPGSIQKCFDCQSRKCLQLPLPDILLPP